MDFFQALMGWWEERGGLWKENGEEMTKQVFKNSIREVLRCSNKGE